MEIDLNEYVELIIFWGMRVLSALAILIAGWVIGNWIKNRVNKVPRLDNTLSSFLGGFAKYVILAVAFIAVLGQFGIQTASLLAVLGAAGLAIGLALQGTLSNVAAGSMILILRPFNVGDYITFGNIGGTIKTLGLFGAELSMPDNVYVFAPNSKIWGSEITNYSRNPLRRQDIKFGISYDSDINKAMQIVQNIVDNDKRIIKDETNNPFVVVTGLGDSSVDMMARIWTDRADFFTTQWDTNKAIKEAFDQGGVGIPFPTRTLEISNLESLQNLNKAK